jgi:hypothetical protein
MSPINGLRVVLASRAINISCPRHEDLTDFFFNPLRNLRTNSVVVATDQSYCGRGVGVGLGVGTGRVPIPNSSGSGSVEVA